VGPHTLIDETVARLQLTTTTAWRRVNVREVDEVTEQAGSRLSAWGYLEVRIIAAVEMGEKKMPKCRYIGGGEWWSLVEKELDRLVPSTWMGKGGKPKGNLLKRANVVAIRLTSDGVDCNQAVKDGTWREWVDARPRKIKAYLRCDGIDTRGATKPVAPEWSGLIGKTVLRKLLAPRGEPISPNTLNSRLIEGEIPAPGKIRYQAPRGARKIQVTRYRQT